MTYSTFSRVNRDLLVVVEHVANKSMQTAEGNRSSSKYELHDA